jgi:cytochrome d ubiquinol oxidase subunit II
LLVILIALIVRGVAFEFRGKGDTYRWRRNWDRLLVVGSLVPAVLWGAVFGNIARGLPLDAGHVLRGGLGGLLNWSALVGGLVTVTLFLLHGALFLSLRTTGELRARARRAATWIGPLPLLTIVGFVAAIHEQRGTAATAVIGGLAVVAVLGAWAMNRRSAGVGFALTSTAIVAATATLFLALYPAVLPSTIDSAYDLTVHNASSTDYTLTIMTWAAGIFLPIVLAYQGWTYWIFAKRIGAVHSPAGPRADRAASEEADASR